MRRKIRQSTLSMALEPHVHGYLSRGSAAQSLLGRMGPALHALSEGRILSYNVVQMRHGLALDACPQGNIRGCQSFPLRFSDPEITTFVEHVVPLDRIEPVQRGAVRLGWRRVDVAKSLRNDYIKMWYQQPRFIPGGQAAAERVRAAVAGRLKDRAAKWPGQANQSRLTAS